MTDPSFPSSGELIWPSFSSNALFCITGASSNLRDESERANGSGVSTFNPAASAATLNSLPAFTASSILLRASVALSESASRVRSDLRVSSSCFFASSKVKGRASSTSKSLTTKYPC